VIKKAYLMDIAPHGEEAQAPEQAELCEAVANGAD
jgi:hypothetical protein